MWLVIRLSSNHRRCWWWSLREKCPYSELFWSVFSRIRTNNSEYGHFLRSGLSLSDLNDTQVSKLIFVITGEREIHAWHDLRQSLGLMLKRSRKGGIQFYAWIYSYFRGGPLLCVAIIAKLIQQITHQITSVSLGQNDLIIFVIWAG